MKVFEYDRVLAVNYAKEWAFDRNPNYYNFDKLGGDCTNFISQCVYAGAQVMNYQKDYGWYYNSLNDRAPAWTGVLPFARFLLSNNNVGPFARTIPLSDARVGDVIQLYKKGEFFHSLIITSIVGERINVSAHTKDVFDIPLYSYYFERARCLHIEGVRK
ncbi:MAG: amidase domain-containing protein [Clostridia bacterium]|nr:amidase domain-containing protein [Clostridia bacterium]